MRQDYYAETHEYNTSYDATRVKLHAQACGQSAQDLVAENARAQEQREQQTRELAPGAYMMGKIVESNGSRYRSGRGEDGRYMTAGDYASLYHSRRVCHVSEQSEPQARVLGEEHQPSRVTRTADTSREAPVRSVRESGRTPRSSAVPATGAVDPRSRTYGANNRPRVAVGAAADRAGKAPMTPTSTGKASATPIVRREVAAQDVWRPSGERYIRVRNQKRFPLAMVMMVVAVSVSLMLIVFGSVMTSHMQREVCALENELEALYALSDELEGELALKNDPIRMEQLAREMGMVKSEYVEMGFLQVVPEEYTVVYDTEQQEPGFSLSTLLSAIGFIK